MYAPLVGWVSCPTEGKIFKMTARGHSMSLDRVKVSAIMHNIIDEASSQMARQYADAVDSLEKQQDREAYWAEFLEHINQQWRELAARGFIMLKPIEYVPRSKYVEVRYVCGDTAAIAGGHPPMLEAELGTIDVHQRKEQRHQLVGGHLYYAPDNGNNRVAIPEDLEDPDELAPAETDSLETVFENAGSPLCLDKGRRRQAQMPWMTANQFRMNVAMADKQRKRPHGHSDTTIVSFDERSSRWMTDIGSMSTQARRENLQNALTTILDVMFAAEPRIKTPAGLFMFRAPWLWTVFGDNMASLLNTDRWMPRKSEFEYGGLGHSVIADPLHTITSGGFRNSVYTWESNLLTPMPSKDETETDEQLIRRLLWKNSNGIPAEEFKHLPSFLLPPDSCMYNLEGRHTYFQHTIETLPVAIEGPLAKRWSVFINEEDYVCLTQIPISSAQHVIVYVANNPVKKSLEDVGSDDTYVVQVGDAHLGNLSDITGQRFNSNWKSIIGGFTKQCDVWTSPSIIKRIVARINPAGSECSLTWIADYQKGSALHTCYTNPVSSHLLEPGIAMTTSMDATNDRAVRRIKTILEDSVPMAPYIVEGSLTANEKVREEIEKCANHVTKGRMYRIVPYSGPDIDAMSHEYPKHTIEMTSESNKRWCLGLKVNDFVDCMFTAIKFIDKYDGTKASSAAEEEK